MDVTYLDGNHEEFIKYLYSNQPKEVGSIQLECPLLDRNKNKNLHIFEQLLMIFTDGLKYFYSNSEGRVNICELDKDKIDNINNYFKSLNYKAEVDVFQTIHEYQFKYPNYFKDQTKITDQVQLKDFYYEMYDDLNVTYRVSFDNL
tara:strand:- start:741 stop:1178 length:438 start_codon:yes stop_codon:yes gene_type:complete